MMMRASPSKMHENLPNASTAACSVSKSPQVFAENDLKRRIQHRCSAFDNAVADSNGGDSLAVAEVKKNSSSPDTS